MAHVGPDDVRTVAVVGDGPHLAAEIAAVEEEPERGRQGDGHQERHQPAHVQEHGPEPHRGLGERRADALWLGTEGHQRGVLEHERDAQHQENLHLVRRVDDAIDELALDDEAGDEQDRGGTHESDVRIDAEPGGAEPGQVHRPHHEVAVGEVHDAHHAEDQREADRHQAVDAAEEQAADHRLDDEDGVQDQALGRGKTNLLSA